MLLQPQLFLLGSLIAFSLGNFANVPPTLVQQTPEVKAPEGKEPEIKKPEGKENIIVVETASGPSEIGLAKHLKQIRAKMYSAYWCPHCQAQLALFGKDAAQHLELIECDAEGKDAKPEWCKKEKIKGYPTWILNNRRYAGTQSLNALANASAYRGPRKFINSNPK
jgi:thiol-disulfide isomerase/thioredoxin